MNARDEALRQLIRARLPGWDTPRLQSVRVRESRGEDDARDIGLGIAIARSVTKNLLLLQHLIAHYSGRRLNQVDPLAQMVLAIGLAQLRFFTRLPPYAVVDQAVEQAKSLRLGKASGFINAVLRRALREPEVPLPDQSDAQEYARVVHSHPPALFQQLAKVVGIEGALKLAERHNQEPPLIVRKIASTAIDAPEGVTVTPHERQGMFVVEGANESLLSQWSTQGIAQAQDPTSAAIIDHLAVPATGSERLESERLRVCDRCSGVGTKTQQIAELSPDADILAVDPAKHRVRLLERTAAARGTSNIRTFTGTAIPETEAPFDRILIDAPCSNSGVLIRRPEAKYKQSDANLRSVEKLQREILVQTVPFLKRGGTLVYSTCSIWPEENERQLQWLLEQNAKLKLIEMQTTLPTTDADATRHHDGGFYAVMRSEG